ncbi:Mitochondrial processing peptidase-like protein [Geitlerinema sp. FC II]|nr:pitrilysin family protein [Geitlerinema sp. CS-897]PPT05870.1 Mitochondrial processing peptidase-like protein [Geitlerinema sp. FC II]
MTSTLLSRPSTAALNAPTIRSFPGGLTVIAEQVPVEAVNLSLWLNVGAAVEPDPIAGTAHFLEHMIFKGSDRLQMGEFERRIEARGAVTNAATSHDYTHFYITSAPQDFAHLAPLQMDVVMNPQIANDAFDRERHVVLEEIRRAEDNPRRRLFQQTISLAFEELPYRRPVLGSEAVIESLTAEQMREFHNTWYHPRSMTAVAVGNLPVDRLIDTVAEGFFQISSHDGSGLGTFDNVPPEPAFAEVTRREYVDPSLQQARLCLLWRVPGLNQLDETHALDILGTILGQGRTARLIRDLREERGLVTRIGAGNLSYRMQGVFQISAQLPTENLEEVEAAIVRHIEDLHAKPVLDSEIDRIRTQVANRFVFGNERPSDRANLYGYFQALIGDLEPAIVYPETVRRLTPKDLQQAAQRYLSPKAYGVVIARPE